MRSILQAIAAAAMVLVLANCGGGGGYSGTTSPPPPPPSPITFNVTGSAVVKIRPRGNGLVVLEEKLSALTDPGPRRALEILDDLGHVTKRFDPPAGWSLVDFAVHPLGEISLALANSREVRLMRIDGAGTVRVDSPLLDEQAPNDPFFDEGGIHDDTSMVPYYTRDAVQLAPIGEDLAVALRTGRLAVIAYRFRVAGASYAMTWRTLVEPGLSIFAVGIKEGSFDTFGQLENHFHVHLDADSQGRLAVAVLSHVFNAPIFRRHAEFFHEPITATMGAIATRLTANGERVGSTVIDTTREGELYGVRLEGDALQLSGRVFTQQRADGTGWDAWFARVDAANGNLAAYRVIDVQAGDVLFDTAQLGPDRFVAAGATGYTQNPAGGSISENSAPLLLVLAADGSIVRRVTIAPGPRQNELRSLAQRSGLWSVGGLVDGPGTHSGDFDPSVIRADGFVRPFDPGS